MRQSTFSAVAVLLGTVVGAGIFGVPYVISKVGLIPGFFYLILIGLVNVAIFLAYGEVVLRTKEEHQLSGHAEKYLNRTGKNLAGAVMIFSNLGALLVYLIGIGEFARVIFGKRFSFSSAFYSLIFFVIASLAILVGLRMIVIFEKIMVLVVMSVVAIFCFFGFPKIDFANLIYVDLKNILLPYGVLLFAYSGVSAVVYMKAVLEKKRLMKTAIWLGASLAFLIYFFFALAVVGVSGRKTSGEAITGLIGHLGGSIVILGALLGIMTMGTSFLTLGLTNKDIFTKDYHLPPLLAWALTCLVPLIIFLLRLVDFITVIGIIGSVAGGLNGILVLIIHRAAKKRGDVKPAYVFRMSKFLYYPLILVFVLGMIYEIVFLFIKK